MSLTFRPKTWRQQVPPEAPMVHRLDMRSPPFFRELFEHGEYTPGRTDAATLLKLCEQNQKSASDLFPTIVDLCQNFHIRISL